MTYHYCYILFSNKTKNFYISSTADLRKAMGLHNSGQIWETKNEAPFDLIWYSAFPSRQKAKLFEQYLKSDDGKIFMEEHLTPVSISALHQEKPSTANTCPVCNGSGRAVNDMGFYMGNRYSKNESICLTCRGKGWIVPKVDA